MSQSEKAFLADPLVCKTCKAYWLKYRRPKAPWVCLECAALKPKEKKK